MAILQGEWDVPILGKYEAKLWQAVVNDDAEQGIIPMDWETFVNNAGYFGSTRAFAVLLPFTREKVLRTLAEEIITDKFVTEAIMGERTKYQNFTAFDHVTRNSSSERMCVVQFWRANSASHPETGAYTGTQAKTQRQSLR